MRLNILLKLKISHCLSRFLAYLEIFHTVVTNDAAPKSVVKVKSQRLFVLAKDSLYNTRHLKSQLRYSLDI